MARPLAEQVVVVTGATSGIGRATVTELVHRGAQVVAAARGEPELQRLVEESSSAGREVLGVPTDVSVYGQVEELANAAVSWFGRIDTWVNCAAVHEYAWFEDTTPEEFASVLSTNVMGQVHGMYAALPHLAGNEAGAVVIGVSSVEGVRAVPLQAPYVTSKFALRGFYDTLRMEMARRHPKVRVVTILPASIDTPIFEHARTRLAHLPMAPKPLYAPQVVARAIVHAAGHPQGQREVPVGGSAVIFLLGQRFAPGLMDVLLTRQKMMFGQQETELPAPEQDNLEHAATGPGTAHSERLESSEKVKRVRDRSLFTELVWQRPTVKRGAATAAAAGLGLLSGTVLNAGRKRLLGR